MAKLSVRAVVIDHRERSGALATHLLADASWQVEFAHLNVGDYLVDPGLLVERKTLIDLVESIKDGRLFKQALRMPRQLGAKLRGQERPVRAIALLIEGATAHLCQSQMRPQAIRAALATVSTLIGIPVLRTTSAEESAQLLASLASQMHAYARGGLPRFGRRPSSKRRLQIHLLQGLPGVGPERAARLLEEFDDVRSVCNADELALSSVAGIGRGIARKICWSLG